MRLLTLPVLIGLVALLFVSVTAPVFAEPLGVRSSDGRLLVLEPPKDFKKKAAGMGFSVGKEFKLEALDMNAVTITVPKGETKEKAQEKLEHQFPGIIVDNGDIAS